MSVIERQTIFAIDSCRRPTNIGNFKSHSKDTASKSISVVRQNSVSRATYDTRELMLTAKSTSFIAKLCNLLIRAT